MYAVVTTGGKQYKVEEGETLKVEKIPGDVGSSVKFERVLMISDGDSVSIGQPVLDDAWVEGHIVEQGKSKKIIVFKYKRRKRYRRKHGHRQQYTAIKIDSIRAKKTDTKKAEPETEAKKPADKKVEAKEAAAGIEAKKPEAPKDAVEKKAAKKPEAKAEAKKKETKKAVKPKAKKAEAKPKAKKAATKKAAAKKNDR
jgi:large subunit ribosomal protein L21